MDRSWNARVMNWIFFLHGNLDIDFEMHEKIDITIFFLS